MPLRKNHQKAGAIMIRSFFLLTYLSFKVPASAAAPEKLSLGHL